jgi:hypothetical protein
MKRLIAVSLFLLFSATSFASETLLLSDGDSGVFYDLKVILPLVKTEIVTENGRELVVHTRSAQTSDHLASFVCIEKQYAGFRLSVQCSATVDSTIEPNAGNYLQEGGGPSSGMLRATISNANDLRTFGEIFRNTGSCQPSMQTRLFAAEEKRKIVFPNGNEAWLPLLSVKCLGARGSLSQLVIDLVPREI